jgi:hypothetical protein
MLIDSDYFTKLADSLDRRAHRDMLRNPGATAEEKLGYAKEDGFSYGMEQAAIEIRLLIAQFEAIHNLINK